MGNQQPARRDVQRGGEPYQRPNNYQNRNAPAVAEDAGPIDIRDVPTDEVLLALTTTNDWSQLSPAHRLAGVKAKCKAIGVDPMSGAFEFIAFQGTKLTLYPTRSCTDQLRMIHGVSIDKIDAGFDPDLKMYFAKVTASDKYGRTDYDEAWLDGQGLTAQNARMKVITKAKRRVTLSICGLGAMIEAADAAEDQTSGVRVTVQDGTEAAIAAPSANDWRRLHAVAGERGCDHDDIKAVARSVFGYTGTLKVASPTLHHQIERFFKTATLDELEGAIAAGVRGESWSPPDDALESRQTNEAAEKVSAVIEDEIVAGTPDAVAQDANTDDATDAEYVDEDGVIHGGGDSLDDLAADLDSIDADAPAEPKAYENAVATHLALINEATTATELRKASESWRLTGFESDDIKRAADRKKAEVKSNAPVFGQTPPPSEAGNDRYTQ